MRDLRWRSSCDRLTPDIADTAFVLDVQERATVSGPSKPRSRNIKMLRRWPTVERHDNYSTRRICRRAFVVVSDHRPIWRPANFPILIRDVYGFVQARNAALAHWRRALGRREPMLGPQHKSTASGLEGALCPAAPPW